MPRQRAAEGELVELVVDRARFRRGAIHLGLDDRELHLLRLAGDRIGLADDVERHLRPPAVAVAIPGGAIRRAGAARGLVGLRLEVGEALGLGVEAHGAVRRRGPDLALAVDIDRDRAAERRHVGRGHVDVDLLGLGIELAQAAAAGIDVEPEIALLVARQPMGVGREPVVAGHLEQLDLAGLGVDAADRGEAIGIVRREPEIAVEIHAAVMGDEADLGGRPHGPVGAVVGLVLGADAGLRHERQVVELPHRASGFA